MTYQNEIKMAQINTRNLAAILETRFEATLHHADADLTLLAKTIPRQAMVQKDLARYQQSVNEDLDRRLLSMDEIVAYRVYDASGDMLYSSNSAGTAPINMADRNFFRLLRDDPARDLVFSEVLTGRRIGSPILVIARAIRGERGKFLGSVHGVIDLDFYRRKFQLLDVGAHGVIALRRTDDHAQLVRWPDPGNATNTRLAVDHPVAAALASGSKALSVDYVDRDGIARVMAVQAMPDYPFYFAVGLARHEVLAGWRTEVMIVVVSSLLLVGVIGVVLLRLGRMRVREAEILATLARSEAQFRELAQVVPVGIGHFDADGLCTYVNDRHLHLVGRSREQVLGSAWSAFIHPDDTALVRRLWETDRGTASTFCSEFRYVRPDERVTHVLGEAQSRTNASGAIIGHIVAQTDISRLKQVEAELILAKQQAEKANRAKMRFLAAAAHDLRQPIQAINLFRTALSRTELNEEQVGIANFLGASVQSLNDLLYSLLDISRLDAGQVTPHMTSVSVHELFKTIEREFSPLAGQKKLRFKLFYPEQDMLLFADPGLLRTALRNLIDNALKYTERQGVLVAARQRHGRALIQVWDTGIGIDPAHAEQVFDEFFQVDNLLRERTRGFGLGLSIARRMARLCAGEVSYRSRPGRGSLFEISLPLAPADDDEGAAA